MPSGSIASDGEGAVRPRFRDLESAAFLRLKGQRRLDIAAGMTVPMAGVSGVTRAGRATICGAGHMRTEKGARSG